MLVAMKLTQQTRECIRTKRKADKESGAYGAKKRLIVMDYAEVHALARSERGGRPFLSLLTIKLLGLYE